MIIAIKKKVASKPRADPWLYYFKEFRPSQKDVSNYKKNVSKLINNFKSTEDDSTFCSYSCRDSNNDTICGSKYDGRATVINHTKEEKFPSMIDQQIDQSKKEMS